MSAACLGLEVDGVTGQAYLLPFKGKAQLVIGYNISARDVMYCDRTTPSRFCR
jgi:RecT family